MHELDLVADAILRVCGEVQQNIMPMRGLALPRD
jgi:hypothetical protein